MAYSTNADLQNQVGGAARLVQLCDLDGDRLVDQPVIDAAIASADAEINSYLGKQRLVPMATPYPQMIIDISARMAIYRMRYAKGMPDQWTIDQHVLDLDWLKAVADGRVTLGVDPEPAKASSRIDASTERASVKEVGRKKLHGFS